MPHIKSQTHKKEELQQGNYLTHCRLDELSHTMYLKSPFWSLGRSGYMMQIFLQKNG